MRSSFLFVASSVALAATIAACADDSADGLTVRRGSRGSTSESDPTESSAAAAAQQQTAEQEAFAKVQPEFLKNCGRGCHDTGAFSGAPAFLKGPDVYASIKNQPGVVVRDVFASTILTKGPHAGPAVSSLPDFEKLVTDWLEVEAVAIQSQKLPSSAPAAVTIGDNEIDLSPASNGKLTNVHLKFKAELVGTMLSLTNVRLAAPAGTDVHIVQPKFVRVTDGAEDVEDPADSFSNSDQTVPGGQESGLSPGAVLFSASTWRPFDPTKDEIRIEVTKLEPGKVAVVVNAATCADPDGFAQKVLPTLRNTQAQGGNGQTCVQCHGGGLAGLSLSSDDASLVCNQVLGKLSKDDIPNSLIVKKVTGATHQGGAVADANAWTKLFTDNAAVFFKK
jgi:hypothetical protein